MGGGEERRAGSAGCALLAALPLLQQAAAGNFVRRLEWQQHVWCLPSALRQSPSPCFQLTGQADYIARCCCCCCCQSINPCRDINRTCWGVDLVEEHILASAGLPARPRIARRPLAHLAEYSINAPTTGASDTEFDANGGTHSAPNARTEASPCLGVDLIRLCLCAPYMCVTAGIIEHADFLTPWQTLPEMVYARPLVQPGDKVGSLVEHARDHMVLNGACWCCCCQHCGCCLNGEPTVCVRQRVASNNPSCHAKLSSKHVCVCATGVMCLLLVCVACGCMLCCVQVVCVEDGMPSWVCEVCVTKPTVRQAIQTVKQIEKDLHLPIKPLKANK